MAAAILHDTEFGTIAVRRSLQTSGITIRLAPDGSFRASIPVYAPIFLLKRFVQSSRPALRRIKQQHPLLEIHDGMQVGKQHSLYIRTSNQSQTTTMRRGNHITIVLGKNMTINDPKTTEAARAEIIRALRREAKAYLPGRLAKLAADYGFAYSSVRFSHASSRWGSCSSKGTISLNIALMKLDHQLIDYVLLHELCHTRQMNHSPRFWQEVAAVCPDSNNLRKKIKIYTPSI